MEADVGDARSTPGGDQRLHDAVPDDPGRGRGTSQLRGAINQAWETGGWHQPTTVPGCAPDFTSFTEQLPMLRMGYEIGQSTRRAIQEMLAAAVDQLKLYPR